jgi:hypothetical protein
MLRAASSADDLRQAWPPLLVSLLLLWIWLAFGPGAAAAASSWAWRAMAG